MNNEEYKVIAINDFNHDGNVTERVVKTFDNLEKAARFYTSCVIGLSAYRKETRYVLR